MNTLIILIIWFLSHVCAYGQYTIKIQTHSRKQDIDIKTQRLTGRILQVSSLTLASIAIANNKPEGDPDRVSPIQLALPASGMFAIGTALVITAPRKKMRSKRR